MMILKIKRNKERYRNLIMEYCFAKKELKSSDFSLKSVAKLLL